jgi:hypothetical protein
MSYLNLSEMFGPPGHIHPLETDSNRARGDNDNAVSISAQFDGSLNNQRQN